MTAAQLINILKEYPGETEILVARQIRDNGASILSSIASVEPSVNMDTNRISLAIKTITNKESKNVSDLIDPKYEREEPYGY